MKQKQFLILAAVAFFALMGALLLNQKRAPVSLEGGSGKFLPALEADLNAISQLKVTGASNTVAVTLNKASVGWMVEEKANYPANIGKVREVLLGLSDARVLEDKTAQKDLYAKLGVEDVADAQAGGVRVDLSGGSKPISVIVGKTSTQGSAGTFVRASDSAVSKLVSGTITVPKVPAEWLKKELLDVQASDIKTVSVIRPDGRLSVSKNLREDQNFVLQNIPPKREVASEFVANGLAGFVGTLNFDDVAAKAQDATPPSGAFQLETQTFDGRVYLADLWEVEGKQYMTISARFDEALAQANQPPEPQALTDGADANAVATRQALVAKAKADGQASLEKARKSIGAFTAETSAWTYTVPSFKFAQANKKMDEMLKQPEAAAKP